MGEAIARNLYEMSSLKVPVLCILYRRRRKRWSTLPLQSAMRYGCLRMRHTQSFSHLRDMRLSSGRTATELRRPQSYADYSAGSQRLNVIEQVVPEYGGR